MTISIDGAAMQASVHRLQRAWAGIGHELGQLAAGVGELRGRWSGEAQQAFDDAHAEWEREIVVMAEILGQAIAALQTADAAAGDAERAATALWR
jgi:WXG100 family type VII secretion target